jgi:hypothetical protein
MNELIRKNVAGSALLRIRAATRFPITYENMNITQNEPKKSPLFESFAQSETYDPYPTQMIYQVNLKTY